MIDKTLSIFEQYAEVFSGISELEQEYNIKVDTLIPPAQQTPRKLPFAMLEERRQH